MEKEIYVLDRIEEGIAAVINSDNATLYVSASRLPENSKSGDCFTFEKGRFFFDFEETKKRRKEINSLLDEIITKK